MRISTSQIYDLGVSAIERTQSQMLHTQQQVALGKRMLTPADDQVAAAQALTVSSAKDTLGQFQANVATAKDALGLNDSLLGQVGDALQNLRTLAVNAGDPALADSDRASLATEASSILDQLVGLANSRDGDGRYVFAGFAIDRQPFASIVGGVAYSGDQGTRTIDVAPGRSMPVGINGSALFEQIRDGNGRFVASPASTNTGSGLISQGTVVNAAALTSDTYGLNFSVVGGVTTYAVVDLTTSATVSSGNAYTSGTSITVAGMQVAVSGAPASGDAFTLAPSSAQSIFTTVQNLINTLRAPAAGPAAGAALNNGIGAALGNIDLALDHTLTARATVGASLKELDALDSGNSDRAIQYDQTMSRLTDLDYNQALSDYARQQLALEAAQKSFAKVTGLSLFNYL
jgi:flagellar hook-associated protein 3 FlgL